MGAPPGWWPGRLASLSAHLVSPLRCCPSRPWTRFKVPFTERGPVIRLVENSCEVITCANCPQN